MDSIYVFLRKKVDLTQQEIVTKYNDMEGLKFPPLSEQFLRRIEQGMVSENDHLGLTEFWNRYLKTHQAGQAAIYDYRDVLLNIAAGLNCPVLPIDTNPPGIEVCYESWFIVTRYALRKHAGVVEAKDPKWVVTSVAVKYDRPNSVYAFCRLLKLHPFVVQRWVKQGAGAIMPVGVRTALEQAGWTII